MADSSPFCDRLKGLFSTICFLIGCFIGVVVFVALFWVVKMRFIPYDHPMFYITAASATSLLNASSSSTWNLTLGVANSNIFYEVSYEKLNISLLYGTHDQLIAQTELGSDVLTRVKQKWLYPQLYLSPENIGSNVVEDIVRDEIRGWMMVQIRISYVARLMKKGKGWESMKLECGTCKMIFDKTCNCMGYGIAPDISCYDIQDAH